MFLIGLQEYFQRFLKTQIKSFAEKLLEEIKNLSREELIKSDKVANILGYEDFDNYDEVGVYTRGYRILNKVHRLPASIIENLVNYFGNFQEILQASIEELDEVEGIGEIRATYIKNGLIKLKVVLGNGHI